MKMFTALCVVLSITVTLAMNLPRSRTGGYPIEVNAVKSPTGNAQPQPMIMNNQIMGVQHHQMAMNTRPMGRHTPQYQMPQYYQQQYQSPGWNQVQNPYHQFQQNMAPFYPQSQQQYDPHNRFQTQKFGQQQHDPWGQRQQQPYNPFGQQPHNQWGQRQQQSYNPWTQQSYTPWNQKPYNPWNQQSYNPWNPQSYTPWNQQPVPGQRQQTTSWLDYLLFDANPQDVLMVQNGVPAWYVLDMNPTEAMAYQSITGNPQMPNMNTRNPATPTTANDLFANPMMASAIFQ